MFKKERRPDRSRYRYEMVSILPLTFLICELHTTFAGPENSPDEDMNTSTLSLCVSHTYTVMIDFNHFKVHSRPRLPPPLPECCSDHLCCPWPCVHQASLSIDLPAITCPSSPHHGPHLVTTPWLVKCTYRQWLFSVYRVADAKQAAAFKDGPKM